MPETMRKKLKSSLLFLCLLVLATSCGDDKKENSVSKVETPQPKTELQQAVKSVDLKQDLAINFDKDALTAFKTCKITDSFLKTREYIIKNFKPAQAADGYLTYTLATNYLGIPVKKIIFGACSVDKPLQKDCSFIEEVAFILDVNFEQAKTQLQTEQGIDFTVLKRAIVNGEEEGATLRPILYKGSDGSTVLHCDTGGL